MRLIYFDNAATSWPKPEPLFEAMKNFLEDGSGNPGRASHKLARKSAEIVWDTRLEIASLFNIKEPQRVIFCFNATDAINLALQGFLKTGDHVITTCLEHNSVLRPLAHLENKSISTTKITCSPEGRVEIADIEKAINPKTRMLAVNHASNVIGSILPLKDVSRIAKKNGLVFLVDAAQTVGCIPIDVQEMGIDLLAFSGHKGLLGPTGTGGLYIRDGVELESIRQGGTGTWSDVTYQPKEFPDKFESGTLNFLGIAGLNASLKFIKEKGIGSIEMYDKALLKRLKNKLKNIEGINIYGPQNENDQIPIVSFNLEGWHPAEVEFILDTSFNILTRSGLHCAPLVHRAIGSFPAGTVRLSMNFFNTEGEVDFVVKCIETIAHEKKR